MKQKTKQDDIKAHAEFLGMAPLFAGIIRTSPAFQAFVRRVHLVKFQKGQAVYTQGQPPTHLYLVRDGEVQIRQAPPKGDGPILAIQGRGSVFGEVSFLSNEAHSSTAEAALDSHIYMIPKEAFTDFMAIEASVGESLARILSGRLWNRMQAHYVEMPARVFTLIDSESSGRTESLATHLGASFPQETTGRVLLVRFSPSPEPSRTGGNLLTFLERWTSLTLDDVETMLTSHTDAYDVLQAEAVLANDVNATAVAEGIPAALGLLKKYYSWILVEAGANPGHPAVETFITQSDRIVVTCSLATHGARNAKYSRLTNRMDVLVPDFRHRSILVLEDTSPVTGSRASPIHMRSMPAPELVSDQLRIHTGAGFQSAVYRTGVHRLARKMTGNSRGLCLGGGGARAFAHVGVLDVLEREGIDFDAVAGTSMGAIIGAGYAMGFSAAEINDLLAEHIPDSASILDRSLPLISFFRGKRLNRAILRFFGNTKFEDLEIPFFCNASDLNSGRVVVFEKGYLSAALRASVSLPGVFPPFAMENYLVVDGGVLNNLPGNVLRTRGYNRVVGVNVTPEVEYKGSFMELRPGRNVIKRMRAYFRIPPILRIVTRALAIESQELLKFRMEDFDYIFNPDVAQFDLFDFDHREKIIEHGRRAAEQHLDDIKEALSKRGGQL